KGGKISELFFYSRAFSRLVYRSRLLLLNFPLDRDYHARLRGLLGNGYRFLKRSNPVRIVLVLDLFGFTRCDRLIQYGTIGCGTTARALHLADDQWLLSRVGETENPGSLGVTLNGAVIYHL